MSFIRMVGIGGVLALMPVAPAPGDEITLKGSVRLEAGATAVHLGDIAELEGARAEGFAATVIAEAGHGPDAMEISVSDVRRALSEAGVHWGKIQLNGRKVIVRPAAAAGTSPPMAMTPASIEQPSQRRRERAPARTFESAADLVDLPTLRGAAARTIVAGLGVRPDHLRLRFDGRDEKVLETDLSSYRFELQPLSSFQSDRIELGVRAWAQGRIAERYDLTVKPLIQTDVAVLRRDVARGEQLHEEDLSGETRWLVPSQVNNTARSVHAVGRVTDRALKAGDVLRRKHVKRDMVIKRGDRVMVRCLVGGVVISLEAQARSDGAQGDQVELRKLGERNTFFGTITGPGSAVVDLSR